MGRLGFNLGMVSMIYLRIAGKPSTMPIIPPSLPWKPLRVAIDVVTAAASRALDPVLDFAAAYPPPRPQPAPLNYVGVITNCTDGTIEQITDPSTLASLQDARNKIIEDSQ